MQACYFEKLVLNPIPVNTTSPIIEIIPAIDIAVIADKDHPNVSKLWTIFFFVRFITSLIAALKGVEGVDVLKLSTQDLLASWRIWNSQTHICLFILCSGIQIFSTWCFLVLLKRCKFLLLSVELV